MASWHKKYYVRCVIDSSKIRNRLKIIKMLFKLKTVSSKKKKIEGEKSLNLFVKGCAIKWTIAKERKTDR